MASTLSVQKKDERNMAGSVDRGRARSGALQRLPRRIGSRTLGQNGRAKGGAENQEEEKSGKFSDGDPRNRSSSVGAGSHASLSDRDDEGDEARESGIHTAEAVDDASRDHQSDEGNNSDNGDVSAARQDAADALHHDATRSEPSDGDVEHDPSGASDAESASGSVDVADDAMTGRDDASHRSGDRASPRRHGDSPSDEAAKSVLPDAYNIEDLSQELPPLPADTGGQTMARDDDNSRQGSEESKSAIGRDADKRDSSFVPTDVVLRSRAGNHL